MATEVKPTIAWLWDCFQKLGAYIETEKFLQSWGTKGSDGLSHDGRNHSSDEVELQALRQQLLERCKILYGMQPIWSGEYWFVNPPRTAALGLKSHELKNMGSALLFMDWELEQRKKEASGD